MYILCTLYAGMYLYITIHIHKTILSICFSLLSKFVSFCFFLVKYNIKQNEFNYFFSQIQQQGKKILKGY